VKGEVVKEDVVKPKSKANPLCPVSKRAGIAPLVKSPFVADSPLSNKAATGSGGKEEVAMPWSAVRRMARRSA